MKRKIIGVTVGSPLPKPNLTQTDPTKGDYVKGKKEFVEQVVEEVDLTGYATEQFVKDGYQPKGNYLTEHQDISGKLDANKLPEAINTALAQAKNSGEFDGKDGKDGKDGVDGQDGYTPQKGVDYFDGQPGKDGVDGKDGYTPVKGVDYFDGNPGRDGVDGKDGSDGYTPVKGKDYFDGKDGKDGTSVTVSNVSESSASGGTNVVTFSDGKKVNIKNGKDGTDGTDGKDGSRGTGILNTTTGIAAYTTAVGGVTPAYRIELSTLKTQAKVDEVLVGDTVRYSYYVYPVIYVDDSYAYLGTRVSIRGEQGAAYTLTDTDKNTIAAAVKADLPTLTVTGIDADGVSHSWTMYGVAQ